MNTLFTPKTTSIVFGRKSVSIQRMLDFDFVCERSPSVACIVDPNSGSPEKVFYGKEEFLIPVYRNLDDAVSRHGDADTLVNFASQRSAGAVVYKAIDLGLRVIATIAEGVPERDARTWTINAKDSILIGPATVGAITAGAFRVGDTGGSTEHFVQSKLHRPGCVGYVGKSGGMSNEMYRMIAENSSGIVEGVAIGGDRFPGSHLMDHLLRYEQNPDVQMLVITSEIGGREEEEIAEALQDGRISKPLVSWVSGTSASHFPKDVQFGHAGAWAESKAETAEAKNALLQEAGAIVPSRFEELPDAIADTFKKLNLPEVTEPEVPEIPANRTHTRFQCTISNDCGEEATYGDKTISEHAQNGSLLAVIAKLWWKADLSPELEKYLEMILITIADHGPCVAGAHNAIVTASAGKDPIDSLCSGLLAIGPRFGGAVDGAARVFSGAVERNLTPMELVEEMKKKGTRIPGIGHKIKSIHHPDARVTGLLNFVRENFSSLPHTDFALEVEKITTSKKPNLILNVDGAIAATLLDVLVPALPAEVQNNFLDAGYFNGLFALGRTIGILGHVFDQKRLKSPLYRHPQTDVLYGEGEL